MDLTTLCQRFFEVDGLHYARTVLPLFIDDLYVRGETVAPLTLSKALLLRSRLNCHDLFFEFAFEDAQISIEFARSFSQYGLQAVGYVLQAEVAFYCNKPAQQYLAYDQAMKMIDRVSPLLRSRILIGMSSVTRPGESKKYFEEAERSYPSYPVRDPMYPFLHLNNFSWLIHAARHFVSLCEFDKAIGLFDCDMAYSVFPDSVGLLSEIVRSYCMQSLFCGLGDLQKLKAYLRCYTLLCNARYIGSLLYMKQAEECYALLESV